MHAELLKQARGCRFFQGALRELAAVLPSDDDGLDRLIGEAVAARENEAFVRIVFAALGAGRTIDARHLVVGASLFDHPAQLAAAAMHVAGDVPQALVAAVEGEKMGNERDATALVLAAVWCKEKGLPEFPPELIRQARLRARRAGHNPFVDLPLVVLSELLQDRGVFEILHSKSVRPPPPELTKIFVPALIDPVRVSVFGIVPEHPGPIVHSGYTVRRAVARIGRNDPCPCGSGKKYKKCCIEKDLERLHESSSVPGLTVEELREQRERFLTTDDLLQMRSYELARLDPLKVADPLKPVLINCLHKFGEHEAAVQLFEKIGVPEDLDDHWFDCVEDVVRGNRKDLLLRLLKVREGTGFKHEELRFAARLLMAEESDGSVLKMIEEIALEALQDPDSEEAMELAYALLDGRWPALGILVSRGLVAHRELFEAEILFDSLLEARDKLNLPPEDPLQTVLEQRFHESIESHRDSEALKKAHYRLDAKNQELLEARSTLARIQAELDRKERERESGHKQEAQAALTPATQPAVDETALNELRRRVASLKDELKERHSERNELRRELKDALADLEELRQKKAETAPDEAEAMEDNLLDEPEPAGVQPVRVPEFSRKFVDSLEELPPVAVRQAMSLIGRLAAGESGAFTGAKRLKLNREIVRQRVGADYRLLFRLHSRTIELVALIPRRDLERKIKSLIAAG